MRNKKEPHFQTAPRLAALAILLWLVAPPTVQAGVADGLQDDISGTDETADDAVCLAYLLDRNESGIGATWETERELLDQGGCQRKDFSRPQPTLTEQRWEHPADDYVVGCGGYSLGGPRTCEMRFAPTSVEWVRVSKASCDGAVQAMALHRIAPPVMDDVTVSAGHVTWYQSAIPSSDCSPCEASSEVHTYEPAEPLSNAWHVSLVDSPCDPDGTITGSWYAWACFHPDWAICLEHRPAQGGWLD